MVDYCAVLNFGDPQGSSSHVYQSSKTTITFDE